VTETSLKNQLTNGDKKSLGNGRHLYLCLTEHHTTKTYREVEVQLQVFLTSILDGDEWLGVG